MMEINCKLGWTLVISLGCHVFILLLATEFAPWKILKSGEKSSIIIQLNDISAEQKTAAAREDFLKERREMSTATTSTLAVTVKDSSTVKKEEKQRPLPAPKDEPAQKEKAVSAIPLTRNRNIGNISAENRIEGVGNWHTEYASKLRDIIRNNQRYPIMAVRNRLQGTVMVGFILNRTGKLLECHITQSCGHNLLDRAALRAVKSVSQFPPFPDSINWDQAGFIVPVTFRLIQ